MLAFVVTVLGGCGETPAPTEEANLAPTAIAPDLSRDRKEARYLSGKIMQLGILTKQDRKFLERHMYDEDGDANKALLAARVKGLYSDSDIVSGTIANLIELSGVEAVTYLNGYMKYMRANLSSTQRGFDQVTQKIIARKNLESLTADEKKQIETWIKTHALDDWPTIRDFAHAAELLVSMKSFSKSDKKWIDDLFKQKQVIAEREMKLQIEAFKKAHLTEEDPNKLRNYDDDLARMNLLTKPPMEIWSFVNKIVQGKPTR